MGAPTAKITVLKETPDELVYYYNAPNQLCVFVQELARVVIDLYGEKAEVVEEQCKKKGADFCRIAIKYAQ